MILGHCGLVSLSEVIRQARALEETEKLRKTSHYTHRSWRQETWYMGPRGKDTRVVRRQKRGEL